MTHKSINQLAESMLIHEFLLSILHYDPDTGIFTWKEKMSSRAMPGDPAGSPHPKLGHISIQIHRRRYLAHRLAWFYVYKEWPKGIIDHIDRNPQNNAISNLRDVNQSINMRNVNPRRDNVSGTPGVGFVPSRSKWRVRIVVKGQEHHIGMFNTYETAVRARKEAEIKYDISV